MANEVSVKLVADITSALKSIESFQKEAVGSLKQVEKSTNQLKFLQGFELALEGGKIAAAALGKAFSNLKSVLDTSIKAASEQEDAIQKLNVALAIQDNYSEKTSKSLQDYSAELQKTSKFADEVILSGTALLESLGGLSEEGLKQGTQAAVDMASALGIDLNSAFTLVGKAAAGEVSTFSRYGVVVRKGADNTETFANTIAALNKQFGGAAAGQLNTYSGAVAQATNSFGDFTEEIGNLIIKNPVIIAGIKQLNTLFIDFGNVIKANAPVLRQLIVDGFLQIIKVVPLVISGLESIDSVITKITQGFLKFKGGVSAVLGFFAELTSSSDLAKEAIADSTATEIGGIEKQIDSLEKSRLERKKVIDQLQDYADGFVNSVNKQADALSKTTIKNNENIKNQISAVRELTEEEQKRFDSLAKSSGLFGLLTNSPEIKVTLADFSAKISKSLTDAEKQFTKSIVSITGSITKGAQGANELVSQGIGAVADVLLPGIGSAVTQIVNVLAQGPEKITELVNAFYDQIPIIIENIAKSIGPLISTIIQGLSEAIQYIIDNFPAIINDFLDGLIGVITNEKTISAFITAANKFAIALSIQAPTIAISFSTALIKEAPSIALAIATGTVDAIKEQFKTLGGLFGGGDGGGFLGGITGGIGSAIGSVGGILGFAEGGEIPQGFPNDSGIIRAQTGERVLDRETNEAFKQLVKSGGLQSNQPLTVILQVGEEQLAKSIFNINKAGFRVS